MNNEQDRPQDADRPETRDGQKQVGAMTGAPGVPVARRVDESTPKPVNRREDLDTHRTPAEEVEAGQASQAGRGLTVTPDPKHASGRPGVKPSSED